MLFGVHKDAQTLKQILDPATYGGTVFSDHAAVYSSFSKGQKCWAHLLRKAIKLTLQAPDDLEYRMFTDELLSIYRKACAVQRDGRLGDAGRLKQVGRLQHELLKLCLPGGINNSARRGLANDYRLLVNELIELAMKGELFTFVTTPPVTQPNGQVHPAGGTNNESERTLRNPAGARDTGRADKADSGCRRRSITTTVLESLRLYLPKFTLTTVTAEIRRWNLVGRSCFAELLAKRNLTLPEKSILDSLYPTPQPNTG
jgi:hypothetical protein